MAPNAIILYVTILATFCIKGLNMPAFHVFTHFGSDSTTSVCCGFVVRQKRIDAVEFERFRSRALDSRIETAVCVAGASDHTPAVVTAPSLGTDTNHSRVQSRRLQPSSSGFPTTRHQILAQWQECL